MNLIPLPVYPSAAPFMDVLRAAKALIDTDVKVVPQDALPGSPGPVLAMGEAPEHLTDYVLVKPDGVGDPVRVSKALEFWLTGGRTHDDASLLSAWFGAPVTLVRTEPYISGVSFS